MIHNQIIGFRISVECWGESKTFDTQTRKLIVGAAVHRRLCTGRGRHVLIYRNRKLKSRCFKRTDLSQCETFRSGSQYIGHVLMLVKVVPLNIKFLQIQCILPSFYIIIPIINGASEYGLFHTVPWTLIAAGL